MALCVGKDLDWINALDIDSFAKLAGKCSEINYPLAVALAKHAPGAAAKVAPLMQKSLLGLKVMAILANELEGAVGIAGQRVCDRRPGPVHRDRVAPQAPQLAERYRTP